MIRRSNKLNILQEVTQSFKFSEIEQRNWLMLSIFTIYMQVFVFLQHFLLKFFIKTAKLFFLAMFWWMFHFPTHHFYACQMFRKSLASKSCFLKRKHGHLLRASFNVFIGSLHLEVIYGLFFLLMSSFPQYCAAKAYFNPLSNSS